MRIKTKYFYVYTLIFVFFLFSCKGVKPIISTGEKKPKYIFFFIGDGMGMNHVTLSENWLQSKGEKLILTGFPVFSDCTTYCRNKIITDSGAAGSAMACGKKADYGVISYYPWLSADSLPPSIAKIAHENGKKVGIITTVAINHATPAAFYAINSNRSDYYEIGSQLAESGFEFFGGGGFKYPQGREKNKEDLYIKSKTAGYVVTSDLSVAAKKDTSKIGILFVNSVLEWESDMPYAIDRDETVGNSLAQIVDVAISYLDNPNGFFMMVEGGKIDWASHTNDAATIVNEVYDFDLAILEAVKFYKLYPDETLIIVSADHETGGVSLGNVSNNYDSNFALLSNQKISVEKFNKIIKTYKKSKLVYALEDIFVLAEEYFYSKMPVFNASDSAKINEAFNYYFYGTTTYSSVEIYQNFGSDNPIALTFGKILSDKAGVGFTTWSHTAAKVPVYSIGCQSELFSGHIDNTDFNKLIRDIMGW